MNSQPSLDPLDLDSESVAPPPLPENSEGRLWKSLPRVMRWIGGISLLGSAIAFLLGGWMDAAPLIRYYSFFALTCLLSSAGIFCALKLKEDKSARTFLSLGTAFIPVLSCQLGAIVFAQFAGSTSQFSESLQVFAYSPIGVPLLSITLAVAAILLSVCAFFGFSAMSRPQARAMTLAYMLANAALLLPFRSDLAVACVGFALLAAVAFFDRKVLAKDAALRTWDGRAMRALLFAPLGLLIVRSLLLYEISELLVGLFSAAIGTFLIFGLPRATRNLALKRCFQHMSLFPFGLAGACLSSALFRYIKLEGLDEMTVFFTLPFAGLVIYLSRHAAASARSFRFIGAVLALAPAVYQLIDYGSMLASLIALATSISCVVLAYAVRQKALLAVGVLAIITSLSYHLSDAALIYRSNLWLSLAGTGVLVILAASFIERNWERILGRSRHLRVQFSQWD